MTEPTHERTFHYQCPNCTAFPFSTPDELIGHQHNECGRRVRRHREVPQTETVATGSAPAANLATPKQVAFATRLLDERPGWAEDHDVPALTTLTRAQASRLIDALLAIRPEQPPAPQAVERPAAPLAGVPVNIPSDEEQAIDLRATPEGTYDVDGTVLRIEHADRGRWAGFTFVRWGPDLEGRAGIQRPGAVWARVDTKAAPSLRLLTASLEAALGYAINYGRRTGACGVCGRTLTDPASIEAGIGPVCARKYRR